jgi:hypothetical protein
MMIYPLAVSSRRGPASMSAARRQDIMAPAVLAEAVDKWIFINIQSDGAR